MSSKNFYPPGRPDRRYVVVSLPGRLRLPRNWRRWALVLALVAGSNVLTHWWFNRDEGSSLSLTSALNWGDEAAAEALYLIDQAAPMVGDTKRFEQKVRQVARGLDVAPEWLMAVMYAESRFDPAVVNRQGSQATGLIQFLPATAQEMGVSVRQLGQMGVIEQLDYVQQYLAEVRRRYGPYQDLTDLYLGILYPKARQQDYCYTLYARPSQAYRHNRGLDEDQDGRVSVSDVDRYLRRLFPTAYATGLSAP